MSFEIINARMVKAYMQDKNAVLIDLRPLNEYLQEHGEGAVHMEMITFEREIVRYDKTSVLIFYCDRGANSMMAARRADEMGYAAKSVIGGYGAFG